MNPSHFSSMTPSSNPTKTQEPSTSGSFRVSEIPSRSPFSVPSSSLTDFPSVSTSPSSDQLWKLVGDLKGNANADFFGAAVALSASGKTVIIGAPLDDESRKNAGSATVYTFADNSYQQLGNKIMLNEGKSGNQFGTSVALSADGYTCIIGAPFFKGSAGSNSGGARVFTLSVNEWVEKGAMIDGADKGDKFGISVDISEDGDLVAVGSQLNDNINGDSAGHVRIFQYVQSDRFDGHWVQVGDPILGEGTSDSFGTALSMSGDGSTIAIGGPLTDIVYYEGHVRIFRLDSLNKWIQLGNSIDGTVKQGQFGGQVSLSQDGNIVGIGMANGGTYQAVQIFDFTNDNWTPLGNSIDGFYGVALSNDGLTVAVSSSVGFGEVRIYKLNNGSWQQTGESIKGDTNISMFGQAVAISGDGSIVASGAPNQSRGEVEIYYNSNGSADGWLRSGGRPYVPPSSSVGTKYLGRTWILQGIAVICTILIVV